MPPIDHQIHAISCLNVGVGPGGTTSMIARVAIVSYYGNVLFDKYVSPGIHVTDYRTSTTGITEEHLNSADAWTFNQVQQRVAELIKDKVLVGHAIWNDLSVLGIPHSADKTRDVALYMPFRNALRQQQMVGLPTLVWQLMNHRIQVTHIDAVENARAAMDLYRSGAEQWEEAIANKNWPCALPPSTFSRCYT